MSFINPVLQGNVDVDLFTLDMSYRNNAQVTYDGDTQHWSIDPLVLACRLKEMYDKLGYIPHDLSDDAVAKSVTKATRERAEEIRKFYTKRHMWAAMRGNTQLSDYRHRMAELLNNRETVIRERDVGIYWKLPWFYDEDRIYDNFKKVFVTTNIPKHCDQERVVHLQLVETTLGWQRKRKNHRYWFRCADNYLYNISILEENFLFDFFRSVIINNGDYKFSTKLINCTLDGMQYYKLQNFKLI